MSFGFSPGDVYQVVKLAWDTFQGARSACGDHERLTQEVAGLHKVLQRVHRETLKTRSEGNEERWKELKEHIVASQAILRTMDQILRKYNALSDDRKKGKKLWQKIEFGSGKVEDLATIRAQLTPHTAAISMSLKLYTLGSLGRVESQLNNQDGKLEGIRESIDWIAAKMTADIKSGGEGSVWTAYGNDDKAFWRGLRRASSSRKTYVEELGERGIFDDDKDDDSESDKTLEAEELKELEEVARKSAQDQGSSTEKIIEKTKEGTPEREEDLEKESNKRQIDEDKIENQKDADKSLKNDKPKSNKERKTMGVTPEREESTNNEEVVREEIIMKNKNKEYSNEGKVERVEGILQRQDFDLKDSEEDNRRTRKDDCISVMDNEAGYINKDNTPADHNILAGGSTQASVEANFVIGAANRIRTERDTDTVIDRPLSSSEGITKEADNDSDRSSGQGVKNRERQPYFGLPVSDTPPTSAPSHPKIPTTNALQKGKASMARHAYVEDVSGDEEQLPSPVHFKHPSRARTPSAEIGDFSEIFEPFSQSKNGGIHNISTSEDCGATVANLVEEIERLDDKIKMEKDTIKIARLRWKQDGLLRRLEDNFTRRKEMIEAKIRFRETASRKPQNFRHEANQTVPVSAGEGSWKPPFREEKISTKQGAYVEDDFSIAEYGLGIAHMSHKNPSGYNASTEDGIRIPIEKATRAKKAARNVAYVPGHAPPVFKEVPHDPRWSDHMEYAGAYLQAARRKTEAKETPPPVIKEAPLDPRWSEHMEYAGGICELRARR